MAKRMKLWRTTFTPCQDKSITGLKYILTFVEFHGISYPSAKLQVNCGRNKASIYRLHAINPAIHGILYDVSQLCN
ncbi:hypothetical protein NC651_000811 [Populus alba x Populus x berolinensis]|nr:hypothetical protein NC651_000811 [Populus alba x Populus x berolinensis]